VFFTIWIIFCCCCAILGIVSQWIIYQKAGKPGWACIIPFYNIYVLLQIVGKPWWWLLLMLIPGVNIVFAIWAVNMLSKSFGKSEGFTVGLLLLGIIFYPILAFGGARYLGPYGDPAAFHAAQNPDFDFEKDRQR
jgi:hypothetical protein